MNGTKQLLDQIRIDLRNTETKAILPVYIDVHDSSLARKWLTALNELIKKNYHLEKNYCFFGFVESQRTAEYLLDQINTSIGAINAADLGYTINDAFTIENTIGQIGGRINHDHFNHLHRYFEDLQGVSGAMSKFYNSADSATRWHIRQLNLLCHEFESLALSLRKAVTAPEWRRPSQLMCWLRAPRFALDENDFELFGVDSINRSLGGVFVGVNKAIGKHHWEVFVDEANKDPTVRIDNLITTSMRGQVEAAGDFDIEWAQDPSKYDWQVQHLRDFKTWLVNNGFDPNDKKLTIGHPQVGQVDLERSFGTTDYNTIWTLLGNYLDVYAITTGQAHAIYNYNWGDSDYAVQQINALEGQ